MKKIMALFKYELKTIVKEPMNLFMLIYPFMMVGIVAFLLPAIIRSASLEGTPAATTILLIAFVMAINIGGYIMGALLGFSILENKDNKTILSISVTPLRLEGYVKFKLVYTYIFGILCNLIMLGGMKIFASDAYVIVYESVTVNLMDNLTWGHILLLSLVNSLLVIFVALVLGGFAKNKIEGFAYIKGGAILIMTPMLVLLGAFQDAKQYILGFLPNFWHTKAIFNVATSSDATSNLPFIVYLLIGSALMFTLGAWMYKIFLKQNKS